MAESKEAETLEGLGLKKIADVMASKGRLGV